MYYSCQYLPCLADQFSMKCPFYLVLLFLLFLQLVNIQTVQAQLKFIPQQQFIYKKFKKMNINENYGTVEMPSEIMDSFEESRQSENEHGVDLNSSIQDTFLEGLEKFNVKRVEEDEQPNVVVSVSEISTKMLLGQTHTENFSITNPTSHSLTFTYQSPFPLLNQHHLPTKLVLEPWQKLQLCLQLKQREDEYGDIYETIIFQSSFEHKKPGLSVNKSRTYVKVCAQFITPSLKVRYEGCSDVINVRGNKLSMNRISKNKQGEYSIQIGFNGVQRLQCGIEGHGDITVLPKGFTLYENQLRKIILTKSTRTTGALVIRILETSITYVLGIEFI